MLKPKAYKLAFLILLLVCIVQAAYIFFSGPFFADTVKNNFRDASRYRRCGLRSTL